MTTTTPTLQTDSDARCPYCANYLAVDKTTCGHGECERFRMRAHLDAGHAVRLTYPAGLVRDFWYDRDELDDRGRAEFVELLWTRVQRGCTMTLVTR